MNTDNAQHHVNDSNDGDTNETNGLEDTEDVKESGDALNQNGNENEHGDDELNENTIRKVENMKLKLSAKVLRKEQGTPMLKPGITCITKGSMYHTDMSATDW